MKFSIGKKLISGYVIIALILGMTNSIFYSLLLKVNDSYVNMEEHRGVIQRNARNIQFEVVHQNSSLNAYLLTLDQNFMTDLQKASEHIDTIIQQSSDLIENSEKNKLAYLKELNHTYKNMVDEVNNLARTDMGQAKMTAVQKAIPLGKVMIELSENISERQEKEMNTEMERNKSLVASIKTVMIVLSLCIIVLAILIGTVISRRISKPLKSLSKASELISSGDLTINDIEVKTRDEIGDLARSFNQMKRNLRQLVRQLSQSAEQVASSSQELTASAEMSSKAAEEISSTIQDVSLGSENQVTLVKESVEAIHETSAVTEQIKANSQKTSSLSKETAEKALIGYHEIQSAVKQIDSIHLAMNQLAEVIKGMRDHSQQIVQIIEVISAISAQTNLLALNAAIEAARAGEHGRGFAVVSDEVRKLAEQSAISAEQITQLITSMQTDTDRAVKTMVTGTEEMDKGIQIVNKAGLLFEEIIGYVDQVAVQTQEVSAASGQMSSSMIPTIDSMQTVSRVSETVAAGTQNVSASAEEQLASMEEISATASSLSQLAEELHRLVRTFKV